MTKRLLTLLMALLLLAGCVPAQAEEAAGPVVTLLDGAGQAVGQGVLLEAGQEVLVPASLAETAGLQVQAGEATIPVSGVEASGELAAVLRLEAQTRDPLPLAAEDPAVFSRVEAVSAQGETSACTVLTQVSLADGWGFTFRDEAGTAQPGSALINDAGELAGLVLGAWADMPNAKVALGARAIATLGEEPAGDAPAPLPAKEEPAAPVEKQDEPAAPGEKQDEPAAPGEKPEKPAGSGKEKEDPAAPKAEEEAPAPAKSTVFLEDISLTMRGADELEVDWAGSEVMDLSEDSAFVVYYGDMDSPYTWWEEASGEETSLVVNVIPGQTYAVWVQHGHGTVDTSINMSEEEIYACVAFMEVPEAKVFNKYGYQQDEIYFCLTTEDGNNAMPAALTFTPEELSTRGQELRLNVTSTYRVKRDTTANMGIAMITPSGECYDSWGEFLFEADLDEDVWYLALGTLQDDYLQYNTTWEPGVYTITVYLDGARVTQAMFTVE